MIVKIILIIGMIAPFIAHGIFKLNPICYFLSAISFLILMLISFTKKNKDGTAESMVVVDLDD